jgi:hypothetical protein
MRSAMGDSCPDPRYSGAEYGSLPARILDTGVILAQSRITQGLFASIGFNAAGIKKYMKEIMIETRIHSGLRINLLIVIVRTRDRRAGLIPHLLTS